MVTGITRRRPREQLQSLTWEPLRYVRTKEGKGEPLEEKIKEKEVSSRPATYDSEDGMKRRTNSLTCFTDYY